MRIYIKNVPGLVLDSPCTDKELIIHLQAQDRGITTGTKVLVNYEDGTRYLDIDAIDRERSLPNIVFESIRPPPPLSQALALGLPLAARNSGLLSIAHEHSRFTEGINP